MKSHAFHHLIVLETLAEEENRRQKLRSEAETGRRGCGELLGSGRPDLERAAAATQSISQLLGPSPRAASAGVPASSRPPSTNRAVDHAHITGSRAGRMAYGHEFVIEADNFLPFPAATTAACPERALPSRHPMGAGAHNRQEGGLGPYQPPWASHPPSTAMLVPVMNDASSLARNATVVAISRGSAYRPIGVRRTMSSEE